MSVQIPLVERTGSKPSKVAARVEEIIGAPGMKKFAEDFDVLVEAAGGISAIRRLVLELAVRGRLTGSCSFADNDVGGPFPLPIDWRWSNGDDLFTFVTSGSRGWARYYADEGPVFLRIGNLDYETIDLDLSSLQHVQPPSNAEGVRTRVEPGDILISITGDTGMVGLVPPNLGAAYINQHIALARPSANVLPAFVARALTAPSLLGRLQGAQRGIKNSLGLQDVRRLPIPVPPLAEQTRIVAKVDQLMALCDELETRQIKKSESGIRLTKSVLQALTTAEGPEEFDSAWRRVVEHFDVIVDRAEKVEDLRGAIRDLAVSGRLLPSTGQKGNSATREDGAFAIPAQWEWMALGEMAIRTDYGTSQKAHEEPRGVAVIRMNNIQHGRLDLSSLKYVPSDTEKLNELTLMPGDLLFNRTNSYELVGKMAVFREGGEYTFASYLIRVRLDPALAIPEYVNLYFGSSVCRRTQIEPHITRQTNQANFNGTKLKDAAVPTPSIGEQKRIVAKVDQLMRLCDELETNLHRAEDRAAQLVAAVVEELLVGERAESL